MVDIEIAPGKRAKTAYSFDDISIVPSRRTREPNDVSTAWQIDAYKFSMPLMAAPMDSVVSPETAIALGKLGGLGVLNLEGLWTRYDDPRIPLGEIASMPEKHATRRMQEIYAAPIRPELIKERINEVNWMIEGMQTRMRMHSDFIMQLKKGYLHELANKYNDRLDTCARGLGRLMNYKRTESKAGGYVPFSGYIYSYFYFILSKHVKTFLIDQLGRKTFPLISDEDFGIS